MRNVNPKHDQYDDQKTPRLPVGRGSHQQWQYRSGGGEDVRRRESWDDGTYDDDGDGVINLRLSHGDDQPKTIAVGRPSRSDQ